MSLTVKAFMRKERSDQTEIRRFSIPVDVSSSYHYLFRKICDSIPSLRHGRFTLFWRDHEGDHISLSSDDELLEALEHVQDGVLKVIIHDEPASSPSTDGGNTVHPGIICDGCEGPVVGSRYKCLTCPDYDLCSACEQRGLHTEHNMTKITTPLISSTGFFPHSFEAHGEGEPTSPRQSTSSEVNGWTMLNISKEPRTRSPDRSRTNADAEADPKIAEALQQLTAMGFNNYGGWLTNLLVSVKGDIDRTLDAMQPHGAANGNPILKFPFVVLRMIFVIPSNDCIIALPGKI